MSLRRAAWTLAAGLGVALASSLACGPSHDVRVQVVDHLAASLPAGVHGHVGPLEVHVAPAIVASGQLAEVLEAVEAHLLEFERRERARVPLLRVGVLPGLVPCSLGGGGTSTGCFSGFTILVSVGARRELPSLYHELAHATFLVFDHADLWRWGRWDDRGRAVAQDLASRRP